MSENMNSQARDTMDKEEKLSMESQEVEKVGYSVESKPPWYLCIILGFQVSIFLLCIFTGIS